MKKYFFIALASLFIVAGVTYMAYAQGPDSMTADIDTTMVDSANMDSAITDEETTSDVENEEETTTITELDEDARDENITGHQKIKSYFIQGGWFFMSIVLICLIIGLALAIERIIMLSLADINSDAFVEEVDQAMSEGGVDAAKKVCIARRGPIASIFYQGLSRVDEGVEMVEKSIVSYGSVQMGLLERGLIWISLFISLAPMLGFMGTVIGMVTAFDDIAAAEDISPSIVANGIKVALLTTLAGLIVAVILQIFYNYVVSKIDSIVNKMEDASISLIDILVKHNKLSK